MRILLDECVPLAIRSVFIGHECVAVKEQGWNGIKNGQLLHLAEVEFDLFITADQNIRYQQNLASRRIPIIEVSTNKMRRLLAAASLLQDAVAKVKSGDFCRWRSRNAVARRKPCGCTHRRCSVDTHRQSACVSPVACESVPVVTEGRGRTNRFDVNRTVNYSLG
jgi:hypothetical protein